MNNKKSLTLYILIILGIILVLNVLSDRIFYRLDVTEDQRYSLSSATDKLLSDLPETVTVTAYFTEDLPPQYMIARREFKELLIEYANASNGELVYEFINPNKDEALEQEAMRSGVQPLLINIREKDQVKQQKAYMGAVVKLRDEKEMIPFIQPGGSYEYALSSAIKKLSIIDKPKVGIISGQGEANIENIGQAYQNLSVLYNIQQVELKDDIKLDDFVTLAIINPKEQFDNQALTNLDKYLQNGGNIFIAMNRVIGDFQTAQGKSLNTGLEEWLNKKGLEVEENFVVDSKCGSVGVTRQQMGFNYTQNVRFPYFPLSTNFVEHPITEGIRQIVFPFASSINYVGDTSMLYTPIILSGEKSGIQTPPLGFNINKQWQESDFSLSNLTLGAVLEGDFGAGKKGRIVIIADGDFAINGESGQQQKLNPENIALLVNSIDYLSDDTGLIQLRAEGIGSRPIEELSDNTKTTLKWLNFLLPILLIIIYGIIRSRQRKMQRLRRRQHGQL